MKRTASRAASAITVATFGLAAVGIAHRQLFESGFRSFFDDHGDARLNVMILEHWLRFFAGRDAFASPNFFFPVKNALGFSDGMLLDVPLYAVARLFLSPFAAAQSLLLALSCLGYAGTYAFVRLTFRLPTLYAAWIAALFALSGGLYMAVWASHTQLTAVAWVPCLLSLFALSVTARTRTRRMLAAVGGGQAAHGCC